MSKRKETGGLTCPEKDPFWNPKIKIQGGKKGFKLHVEIVP